MGSSHPARCVPDAAFCDLETFVKLQSSASYLDDCRKDFMDRHYELLTQLRNGQLRGRNRFRELMLGVKAVGKTHMLRVLSDYTTTHMKNVLVVFTSFESDVRTPTQLILNAVKNHFTSKAQYVELSESLAMAESVLDRIKIIEAFLSKEKLFVLCLFDEFQGAYKQTASVGVPIIQETCELAGSVGGTIHMIVSGSSSVLRVLAFAKLKLSDSVREEFPSYSRKDLNSTKLQPKWITVIKSACHFRAFCEANGGLDKIDARYIYSGGRPGLILENPDINSIPYSITSKGYKYKENSPEFTLLSCLLKCSSSYQDIYSTSKLQNVDDAEKSPKVHADNLDRYENLICNVETRVLQQEFNKIDSRIGAIATNFSELLYDLMDDGIIILQSRNLAETVSISGYYLYLEFNAMRFNSLDFKLNWMELAALKTPKGLFDELAENVAMRIIRSKLYDLFGVEIEVSRLDTTYLNFPDGKKRDCPLGLWPMFIVGDSSANDICIRNCGGTKIASVLTVLSL